MFTEEITALQKMCAFYGFTACPLTDSEITALVAQGRSIEDCYSIACDVAAGFTLEQAASALEQV